MQTESHSSASKKKNKGRMANNHEAEEEEHKDNRKAQIKLSRILTAGEL